MRLRIGKSIVVFFIIVLSVSCASNKKKDQVGFVEKKYHDMTARYNGYFNANELFKASKISLEESYEDNYNQILTVFPYSSIEDPAVVKEDMDIAIKKLTKVATIHDVSKWVDDAYLLVGKAQYLKGDYESAEESFEFFLDDFNPKDPDSRVYKSQDQELSQKQIKRERQRERKIKENEREQARKDQERERKQEQERSKNEKKSRSKKSNNRGKKKRTPKAVIDSLSTRIGEVTEDIQNRIDDMEASASSDVSVAAAQNSNQDTKSKSGQRIKEYDENAGSGFLQHRPVYYEGMLWLAKTAVKREKWFEANYYLDRLIAENGVPSKVSSEIPIVRADLLLQMRDYQSAVPVLDEAIDRSNQKVEKARLTFIKAQVLDRLGNSAEASAAYMQVSKYKASFEMELHAQMNQIKNQWASNAITSDVALRKLNRMAKEDKNIDFVGDIYFTIAEILIADDQAAEALVYYDKALTNSSSSNKSEIYFRLATLNLGRENYVEAKEYYDSTLTVMNEKDERFSNAKRYSSNLKDIAINTRAIGLKDSLLKLSALDREELEEIALKVIKEREKDIQEVTETNKNQVPTTGPTSVGVNTFFAYNTASVQKGKIEFRKRWGNRVRNDHWRRSSKINSLIEAEEGLIDEGLNTEKDYSAEIDKYLRNVPTTDEEKDIMKDQVEEHLFRLGTGYRTYINNYTKSNETLLRFLKRFPNSERQPEAYYYLHLNYTDLGEKTLSDKYRNMVITQYPDSPFAKYLIDPVNSDALLTSDRIIEKYYEETYDLFQKGHFEDVESRLTRAEEEFGKDHKMIAKYDLLKAYVTGKIKGKEEYINELRSVIVKHNNTPEQTYAKEMLRFLRGDKDAFGRQPTEQDIDGFSKDPDNLHYVIVVMHHTDGNGVNKAKIKIKEFNEAYFSSKGLRTTSMFLNSKEGIHLILIRRFQNEQDAMGYYRKYSQDPNAFMNQGQYVYEVLAINQQNYRRVISEKSVTNYRRYFEKEYLGF